MTRIGRNFFSMEGQAVPLADGMSLWTGTFASMRPGWKPFLNVDMASKPGYKEQATLDFLCRALRKRSPFDLNNLTDKRERGRAEKELVGLKVKFHLLLIFKLHGCASYAISRRFASTVPTVPRENTLSGNSSAMPTNRGLYS